MPHWHTDLVASGSGQDRDGDDDAREAGHAHDGELDPAWSGPPTVGDPGNPGVLDLPMGQLGLEGRHEWRCRHGRLGCDSARIGEGTPHRHHPQKDGYEVGPSTPAARPGQR